MIGNFGNIQHVMARSPLDSTRRDSHKASCVCRLALFQPIYWQHYSISRMALSLSLTTWDHAAHHNQTSGHRFRIRCCKSHKRQSLPNGVSQDHDAKTGSRLQTVPICRLLFRALIELDWSRFGGEDCGNLVLLSRCTHLGSQGRPIFFHLGEASISRRSYT